MAGRAEGKDVWRAEQAASDAHGYTRWGESLSAISPAAVRKLFCNFRSSAWSALRRLPLTFLSEKPALRGHVLGSQRLDAHPQHTAATFLRRRLADYSPQPRRC